MTTISAADLIEVTILDARIDGFTRQWAGTADSRRMTTAVGKLRQAVAMWQGATRRDEGFATDPDNPKLVVEIRDHRTREGYVTTAFETELSDLSELLDEAAHRTDLVID